MTYGVKRVGVLAMIVALVACEVGVNSAEAGRGRCGSCRSCGTAAPACAGGSCTAAAPATAAAPEAKPATPAVAAPAPATVNNQATANTNYRGRLRGRRTY
jgi:hypothetical protein